jgi:hypothetical protein
VGGCLRKHFCTACTSAAGSAYCVLAAYYVAVVDVA